jgi:hypothetical protein
VAGWSSVTEMTCVTYDKPTHRAVRVDAEGPTGEHVDGAAVDGLLAHVRP